MTRSTLGNLDKVAHERLSYSSAACHTPRVAVNPVPYWVRDGQVNKSREAFEEAFADFADIGFTAVKADVPEGMTAAEYAAINGLSPDPPGSLRDI